MAMVGEIHIDSLKIGDRSSFESELRSGYIAMEAMTRNFRVISMVSRVRAQGQHSALGQSVGPRFSCSLLSMSHQIEL